jgi:hypothetical protein
MSLARACGVSHPALVPLEAIELIDGVLQPVATPGLFGYEPGWGLPSPEDASALERELALNARRGIG